MNDNEVIAQPSQSENHGPWRRVWVYCSFGCGGLIILSAMIVFAGYLYYRSFADEFLEMGFRQAAIRQTIVQRAPLTEKVLIFAQSVRIEGDVSTDIAIIAQFCEISGHVKGTVYFRGQVLTLKPGAVVDGDLDVMCQAVKVDGTVKGVLKGGYQEIKGLSAPTPAKKLPPDSDADAPQDDQGETTEEKK